MSPRFQWPAFIGRPLQTRTDREFARENLTLHRLRLFTGEPSVAKDHLGDLLISSINFLRWIAAARRSVHQASHRSSLTRHRGGFAPAPHPHPPVVATPFVHFSSATRFRKSRRKREAAISRGIAGARLAGFPQLDSHNPARRSCGTRRAIGGSIVTPLRRFFGRSTDCTSRKTAARFYVPHVGP